MADREKSNSLTHLVKILINEVLDDRLEKKFRLMKDEFIHKLVGDMKDDVRKSACNAGDGWPCSEDEQLEAEVAVMMCKIAKKHGRTLGSIRCRIIDKISNLY